jgi:hypothetical protein
MPGACCTRGLVCKHAQRNAHEHTGTVGTLRHSLRNGFTAYAALSPATNSSCHRRQRIDGFARPGWACKNLRELDTSNGCQDHTVLPYAESAVRPARRSIAHGFESALRWPCATTLPRPPHPVPTFVTMANAPRSGQDGEASSVDLPDAPSGIFLLAALDRAKA